jgi:hypothetical protein
MPSAIFLALVHHPVLDKSGQVVTTALTNVDVHDLARSARTFGLQGCYIVTPVALQQRMVSEMVAHWSEGSGAEHQRRAEAIRRVRVAASIEDACADIDLRSGHAPYVAVTAARYRPEGMPSRLAEVTPYAALRRQLAQAGPHDRPLLLLFGTGWGLAPAAFDLADLRLPPVQCDRAHAQPVQLDGYDAPQVYNHLSVRAAAAIILDRLCGQHD